MCFVGLRIYQYTLAEKTPKRTGGPPGTNVRLILKCENQPHFNWDINRTRVSTTFHQVIGMTWFKRSIKTEIKKNPAVLGV